MSRLPISIHALLAESDGGCTAGCDRRSQISIHALLAESDGHIPYFCARYTKFLSTLSLRRATHQSPHLSPRLQFLSTLSLRRATAVDQLIKHIHVYFYPRSPCGERHSRRKTRPQNRKISIHALLAESDLPGPLSASTPCNFYPRSPCGERLFALLRDSPV